MARSAPLPAPYGGVRDDLPQESLEQPYCYNLLNFNTTTDGVGLRSGDAAFARVTVANLHPTVVFSKYGDTALFALIYDTSSTEMKVYNVETDALEYTSGALGFAQFQPQFFNKNLFFFTNDTDYDPGIVYSGSAWGVIGYTPLSGTFSPRGGGTGYNFKNYIIQDGEAAYWYTVEPNAISGSVKKIDLSGIVEELTTLANIASFTLADDRGSEKLLAFCMANGEILFYSGAYPDAADWTLRGRAQIGQLVSYYNSTFPYQGDTIILSDSGIASLRDLFLRGSQDAVNLSVNRRVQGTWKTIIKLARAALGAPSGPLSVYIRGVWDRTNSRLYINLPYNYTPFDSASFGTSGNFFFVYDAIRSSWYFHRSGPVASPIVYDGLMFYKGRVVMAPVTGEAIVVLEKEGSTGFMDRTPVETDIAYAFDMISAPIPFPKNAVYSVAGIEPVIKSDMYAQTNYALRSDLGRQSTDAQVLTDQGSAVAKPFVNLGIEGTYAQMRMSGSTVTGKTVGINLYGYNVLFNQGAEGSR
jgi:hypothetical protein